MWKLCQPEGQGPGPREYAKSFIIEDNMFIYGGEGVPRFDSVKDDIFVLDLSK